VRRDALAACWILQSALDAVNDEQARISPPPQGTSR
jgi:hypothetical protein